MNILRRNNAGPSILSAVILLLLNCLVILALGACQESEAAIGLPVSTSVSPTADEPAIANPTERVDLSVIIEPTITPEPTRPVPTDVVQTAVQSGLPVAGIQTYYPQDLSHYQWITGAGAAWTHYTVFEWDKIEPIRTDPPSLNWAGADEMGMRFAAQNGLTLIANVSFSPSWAQKIPGYACGPIAQEAFQRFGMFLQEAVLRYSQPPFNIKYWELGNEPDVLPQQVIPRSSYGCWGDSGDPYYGGGYYAEMLKVVYPYVKAADPDAQVLIGGLLLACNPDNPYMRDDGTLADCTSSRFLEGILLNGGGDYFDGVSFHSYDYYYQQYAMYGHPGWHSDFTTVGPVLQAKTDFIRQLLSKYGYPDKSMHATEVAVLCGSTGKEAWCLTDEYQQTKAYFVVYSLASAYANKMESYIWYALNGWRGSELVSGSGEALPAYTSFQFAAAQLGKSAFVRSLNIPGAAAYEFVITETNRRMWLIWSLGAVDLPLILPQTPEAIYNVWGEPQPGVDAIMLTPAPIYVFWPSNVLVDPLP